MALRRERMVAHDIAHMVRRRPFFQVDLLDMFLTLRLNVLPIDKVEVEPRFVVAALIGGAGPRPCVEWQRHREAVPSNTDRIQAVLRNPHTAHTT